MKVLVLDDEPWQLSWVRDLVKNLGGSCELTATRKDAEQSLDIAMPDLVVLDIRIGETDDAMMGATLDKADATWTGLKFLRYIRAEKKSRARVLVYTGLDRERLREIVEDSYHSRYFTKFDPDGFREALIQELQKLSATPQ